jgi:peptidoglycan/LPS O-acetylase OafA/YrhL
VFLDHLSAYPFSHDTPAGTHPVLSALGGYGNTAVIIFFVLSGYVIAYVTSTPERSVAAYAISRVSRLYSVVLPALLLTFACDLLGQHLNAQFYEIRTVLWRPASWQGYLSSLLFVNEYQSLQLNGAVPGSNAPFWSLSFEATYYVVAGLVLFAPRRLALPLAVLLLALAGRTIAALLPLWVLGFAVYHARERLTRHVPVPALLFLTASVAIAALPHIPGLLALDNSGIYFPWGHGPYERNLALDYATAVAFAVQMLAARRLLGGSRRPPRLAQRAARQLGLATFPLYAMHYPVLCLFAAVSPFARDSWAGIAFVTIAVVFVIALMTPLCEWLKLALRRALSSSPAALGARGQRGGAR